ncbi:E3 ubiquitin-protein ligase TTC3 [Cephus cinctus]|uniref:E3 ubiquitin-protein ligase TTC3 n=1 Tax=Cephus cinctus TaxID=211228 RepID=A0AAJ7RCH5_CEPCN|nr:E3 ubiquitin-protein ligase TTC3 [Cephus cinctus]
MLCISGLESEKLEDLTVIVQHLISLEKNIQENDVHFPAVYYALGKAHCKLYRFLLAYDAVNKGFAFLNNNVKINEYCIPTTNTVIPETTREGLLVALVQLKEESSSWHRPDAVCCMDECLDHSPHYAPSRYIFFSDPAFNGMVILTCNNVTHPCVVKFHQSCWKLKKEQLSSIKKLSDKDIIGYKCFTPNCETAQGVPSIIIRVEVVGEGGNIKTRFDAPTNTHSWPKRNPAPPKGAIKKQNKVKQQTPKPRKLGNPSNCIVPVQNSQVKEPLFNEEAEMKWRLKKLAYLRNRNFGIPEETDWRPNKEWFGNSFMKVIAEVLPNPDFTKDDAKTSSLKSFVFSLIYAYIEKNGPVKRADVLRMWNDTKLLIENYNSVLNDSEDIFDFLLQSLKIVAIGEYLCIPKILPQLYNIVKQETVVCLKFFIDNTCTNNIQDQPEEYEKYVDGGTLNEVDIYEDTYGEHMYEEEPYEEDVQEDILGECMVSNYNSGTPDQEVSPRDEEDGFLPTDFISLDNNITSDQIEASTISDVKSTDAVCSSQINELEVMTITEDTEICHQADIKKNPSIDADKLQESIANKEHIVEESQIKDVIAATNDNDFIESNDILDDSIQKKEIKEQSELKKEAEEVPSGDNNYFEANEDYPESTVEKCTDFNEFTWNELFAVYTNEIDDTNTVHNKEKKSPVKKNDINAFNECENADMVVEVLKSKDLVRSSTMHKMDQTKRSTMESRRIKRKYRTIVKRKGMSVPRVRWIKKKRVTIIENKKTMKNEIERLKKENAELLEKRKEEQEKLHEELEDCKRVIQQKISELKMTKDNEIHKKRSFLKKCLDSQYNSNMIALVAAVNQFRESLAIVGGMQDLLEKITAKRVFTGGAEVEWQQLIAHIQLQSNVLDNEFLKLKADLELNENVEKMDLFSLQLQNVHTSPLRNLSKIVETGFQSLIMHYNRVIQHIQMTRPGALMNMPVQRPPLMQQPYIGYPLQYPPQVAMPRNSVIIQNQGLPPRIPMHLNAYRMEGNTLMQNVQQVTPENGQPHISHHKGNDNTVIKKEDTPKQLESVSENTEENNAESQEQLDLSRESAEELPSENTLDLPTKIHSLFSSNIPAELLSEGTKKRKSRKPKKTVFIDDVLQRLRKKYIGVLESDLLDSILDVRRQHKSLTGMKVSVIIEKTAPFIERRQVAQLCDYTRPIKTESAEVFVSPSHTKKKRREIVVPSSLTTSQNSQLNVRKAVEQGGTIKKNPWEIINDQRNKWQKESQEVECNICIEPMITNAKPIYTLSCQHAFHKSCIKSWFRHNQSCPTCRVHCTIDEEFPPLP